MKGGAWRTHRSLPGTTASTSDLPGRPSRLRFVSPAIAAIYPVWRYLDSAGDGRGGDDEPGRREASTMGPTRPHLQVRRSSRHPHPHAGRQVPRVHGGLHASGCTVQDPGGQSDIWCPCHGGAYDLYGHVGPARRRSRSRTVHGEPAGPGRPDGGGRLAGVSGEAGMARERVIARSDERLDLSDVRRIHRREGRAGRRAQDSIRHRRDDAVPRRGAGRDRHPAAARRPAEARTTPTRASSSSSRRCSSGGDPQHPQLVGRPADCARLRAHVQRVPPESDRKPRELTWVTGARLLFLMLGFGFIGYLPPWNKLAFFATTVGTGIAGSVPAPALPHAVPAGRRPGDRRHADAVRRVPRGGPAGAPDRARRARSAARSAAGHEPGDWRGEGPASGRAHRADAFFPNYALRDVMAWYVALAALAVLVVLDPGLGRK